MVMKAAGKSISFYPETLHGAAIRFGGLQSPKQNKSEVVCAALREYFAARGFAWESEGVIEAKFQQRAACLRRLEELGLNVEEELAALVSQREQAAEAVNA